MRILAIDPGQKGALAVVETGPRVVDVRKMPDLDALQSTIALLADGCDRIVIEEPLGMVGGKGAVGLATQHREWGILFATSRAVGPVVTVNPNTWIAGIRAAKGRASKQRRRDQVQRMCGTRVHIYQCDASLIGFWALLQAGALQ